MAKSRRCKSGAAKRKPGCRKIVLGLGSYVPEEFPESAEVTEQRLRAMPAELLPTLGLAESYLGCSPIRQANQATLACWVIMTSLMEFGIHPEVVGARVEVASDRGGVISYGDCNPSFNLSEGTVGHVVLIADGKFLDPTGGQFPEIARAGGVRAVGANLEGSVQQALRRGAIVQLRMFSDDGPIQAVYRLGAQGSADAAMTGFIEQPNAVENVARMSSNLSLIFTRTVSEMPDKLVELERNPVYRKIVAKARRVANRDIVADENGLLHIVP